MRNELFLEHDPDDVDDRDDTTLVVLARNDSGVFAELYRRHARNVFHYLLTYAETVDDASDMTQLVFLRALEALPTYQEQGVPFVAWLFRIARNLATDTYRRRRKTLPWEHIPLARQPCTNSTPEMNAVRRESINRLRLLVAQLDPEKQELIYLRFAGELAIAEIAASVGKSEAAVQRQLHRIIRRLKERYDAS